MPTVVRNLTPAEKEKWGELLGKLNEHVDDCRQCQRSTPPEGMCDIGSSLYQCWEALVQASTVADAFMRAFGEPS